MIAPGTICLYLALICFLLGAIGVAVPKRVNVTALGLFFCVLSLLCKKRGAPVTIPASLSRERPNHKGNREFTPLVAAVAPQSKTCRRDQAEAQHTAGRDTLARYDQARRIPMVRRCQETLHGTLKSGGTANYRSVNARCFISAAGRHRALGAVQVWTALVELFYESPTAGVARGTNERVLPEGLASAGAQLTLDLWVVAVCNNTASYQVLDKARILSQAKFTSMSLVLCCQPCGPGPRAHLASALPLMSACCRKSHRTTVEKVCD